MSQENKSKAQTIADGADKGAQAASTTAALLAAIAALIRTFGKK